MLSAGLSGTPLAAPGAGPGGLVAQSSVQGQETGYLVFRITNPTPFDANPLPPFQQVLVQNAQPVPGQVYNVLFVTMRNSTTRTFNAKDELQVRLTGQNYSVPILTGNQQWKPGQVIVFYVLTKKYYPVSPVVSGGFEFDLDGSRGIAIPGPSGIYLRIRYNPATFPNILNRIAVDGPNKFAGARGHRLGLPDTALWAFKPAATVHGPKRVG